MAGKGTVVVTGISGFVGRWVAAELLNSGYRVRGTLRDMGKADGVMKTLSALTEDDAESGTSFVQADLLDDAGWSDAMSGAVAVMHIATEVRGDEPRDASIVIAPAVEGTRRVLEAAQMAGVSRVVMTSSIATVGYGHGQTNGVRVYNEEHWTNLDAMRWTWAYCLGKTKAERAAWEYAQANDMTLTTIHPGMILGPTVDPDYSVSVDLVTGLLKGDVKAMPNMGFSLSDVRDVAAMHVKALDAESAAGERYLATAPYLRFTEIADILREAYPSAPIPVKTVPNWLLFAMAYFNGPVRQVIDDIGNEKHFDGAKGRELLGHDYRDARTTILDTAKSLINLGIV